MKRLCVNWHRHSNSNILSTRTERRIQKTNDKTCNHHLRLLTETLVIESTIRCLVKTAWRFACSPSTGTFSATERCQRRTVVNAWKGSTRLNLILPVKHDHSSDREKRADKPWYLRRDYQCRGRSVSRRKGLACSQGSARGVAVLQKPPWKQPEHITARRTP
jgi:hypothetical protein